MRPLRCAILCILALALETNSLHHGDALSSHAKRDMAIDCGTAPVPKTPEGEAEDSTLTLLFENFAAVCATSTAGLKLYCTDEGILRRSDHLTSLWHRRNRWLFQLCLDECQCTDIMPSTPGTADSAASTDYDEMEFINDPFKNPDSDNKQDGKQCANHQDCDARHGFICAQPAHYPEPMSTSWGRFKCAYLPHASAMLALAAGLTSCQRGRCLLESNGAVRLDPVIPANITDSSNAADETTAAPASASESAVADLSRTTLSPSEALSALTCPCNCTYFAPGCCLTTTVIETDAMGPSSRGVQGLDPPREGMRCDEGTGLWT